MAQLDQNNTALLFNTTIDIEGEEAIKFINEFIDNIENLLKNDVLEIHPEMLTVDEDFSIIEPPINIESATIKNIRNKLLVELINFKETGDLYKDIGTDVKFDEYSEGLNLYDAPYYLSEDVYSIGVIVESPLDLDLVYESIIEKSSLINKDIIKNIEIVGFDGEYRILLDGQKKEDTAESLTEEGKIKFEKEDYNGALEDYNKALELSPNSASICHSIGNTKIKLEDFQGSIEAFNNAIKLNSTRWWYYAQRGDAKKGTKRL